MLDDSVLKWRQQRLAQLRQHPDFGTQAALAKALGLQDGSYIGQMERGKRPLTEKTIAQIEQLRGGKYRGWFTMPGAASLSARALEVARLFDQLEPRLQLQIEALVHALQPVSAPQPDPAPTRAQQPDRETPA